MEMPKASLNQLLATIPSQSRLNQNVSEVHLADFAKKLTEWKSACSYLGIGEPEEKEIEKKKKLAEQRYVVHLSVC